MRPNSATGIKAPMRYRPSRLACRNDYMSKSEPLTPGFFPILACILGYRTPLHARVRRLTKGSVSVLARRADAQSRDHEPRHRGVKPLRNIGCRVAGSRLVPSVVAPHTGQFSDSRQLLSLYCGGSCEMEADTASPRLATRERNTSVFAGVCKRRCGIDAQARSHEIRSSLFVDIDARVIE